MSWILKIKIFKYFTFTQHKRHTDNADTNAFNAVVTKAGSVMVKTPFFSQNNTQNFITGLVFYQRKGK
jgi:hypothetical protein